MKRLSFTLFCTLMVSIGQVAAQIEVSSQEEEEKEEEMVDEISPLREVKTEVLAFANWSNTSRILRPNSANNGLFGDPLGIREDEGNLNVWSYGVAFRSQMKYNLMWQGGLSWIRNGETFNFEDTESDSTFAYQTFYNYVAMPLKLMYHYGDRVRIYGGVGLVPQMFFSYRQEQQWTTVNNNQSNATVKTKNGYNSFVLSGCVNLGIQLRFNSGSSIFIEPEYRLHLTNSYEKTDSYEHFGRAFGLNVGFSYPIW